MSASALKSTMPGVGASPPNAAHSILPMSVMAQKVTTGGNESASIKPMSGGGLSYVTLQPASQPLSLVQDHRPVAYQNPSYASNNAEKEKEKDKETEVEPKVVQNGVEFVKPPVEPEAVAPAPPLALQPAPAPLALPAPKQQTDGNRNNNQSPENPAQDRQEESKPVPEPTAPASSECPGTQLSMIQV